MDFPTIKTCFRLFDLKPLLLYFSFALLQGTLGILVSALRQGKTFIGRAERSIIIEDLLDRPEARLDLIDLAIHLLKTIQSQGSAHDGPIIPLRADNRPNLLLS